MKYSNRMSSTQPPTRPLAGSTVDKEEKKEGATDDKKEQYTVCIDESQPTTNVQVRFPDGSRLIDSFAFYFQIFYGILLFVCLKNLIKSASCKSLHFFSHLKHTSLVHTRPQTRGEVKSHQHGARHQKLRRQVSP